MILLESGKKQTLVQVTNENTGEVMGLYLVPEGVTVNEFEDEIVQYEDQDDFDENNELGVQRIFADDSVLDVQF